MFNPDVVPKSKVIVVPTKIVQEVPINNEQPVTKVIVDTTEPDKQVTFGDTATGTTLKVISSSGSCGSSVNPPYFIFKMSGIFFGRTKSLARQEFLIFKIPPLRDIR